MKTYTHLQGREIRDEHANCLFVMPEVRPIAINSPLDFFIIGRLMERQASSDIQSMAR